MPRASLPWIFAAAAVTACTVPAVKGAAVCEEGSPGCPAASRPERAGKSDGPVGGPLEAGETPAEQGSAITTSPKDPDGGVTAEAGPPPKPASCLSPANACFAPQAKCGCAEDCCGGLTCGQIGGLVQTSCCAVQDRECTESNDCCGQLQCKPNGAGKTTCQPL
jgi:hypothetical protein